ncbi:MAG TPA: protease inhibitor I42 family protein [Candidatus Competibacter sp.]|nr:protease inhibitor I42 family protein [Candidatus Competibacter sp.]
MRPMPIIRKLPLRRAQTVLVAILAISTALLAAGCASKKSTGPEPVPPAGTRENDVLVLARADNNRTAELRVGERLKVSLPENPSTGYTWAIDETNGRLLALDGTEYAEPTEGFVGARGRRIFAFTARQPGDVALKLKYWRFRDGDDSTTERYVVLLKIVP